MHALSLNDDSPKGRMTGRRHRAEGIATRAITSDKTTITVQLFESVSFE
jgi:hypothetical protein